MASDLKARDRFDAKVDRAGEHHLWGGSRNPQRGTGKLQVDGKQITAHRHAWELANGPIADGAVVNPSRTNRCASGSNTSASR